MKLHVYPTFDRVAVIPDPVEEITESGFQKPATAVEIPLRGTVYAVGPGYPGNPVPFEKGDRVAFGAYAGMPLPVAGTAILLFRAHDILAKLVEEREEGDDVPLPGPKLVDG